MRQYEHSQPLTAGSQGNVQVLRNGNMLIGWGAEPYVSEYTASGTLVWDAILAGKTNSYRAYRFPWTGTPTGSPSVAAAAGASGTNDRLRELERRHHDRLLARAGGFQRHRRWRPSAARLHGL